MTTPKAWLSLSAYARTYGVTRHTVYKWLRHGLLETWRFQTIRRIRNLPPSQQRPPPRAPRP